MEEQSPVPPITQIETPKTNKGWKLATIITSVVALCGIGFGVYEMIQKDKTTSDLKVQIENKDGSVTELDTDKIKTTTEVSGGPYIENNYFYVPKWGVKFKLSDNLTNYGYAVDQNSQGDSYGNYVVGLTAISKSDYVEHPQVAYYNDIFSCSVVTIRTMEESKKGWWDDTEGNVKFNGLDFIIHDIWRKENCTEEFMAPTDTVAEQLRTILSNPEKI